MKYVNFDDALHRTYAKGRQLAPDVMTAWMEAVSGLVGPRPISQILDLGAGTGRFSSSLSATFDAPVLAVDPAAKMLGYVPSGITRVIARAEALPVASAAVDLLFASMVLHHFSDLGAAAAEVARVLRPNGALVVRTCFPETLDAPYHAYFPTVLALDMEVLPTRSDVFASLEQQGLRLKSHIRVRQRMDSSLRSYADRVAQRAMSPMRVIPDAEFEDGMAALRAAASRETEPSPVFEDIDLLAFRLAT